MTNLEAVRLYSVATVAEMLEVSPPWVYERIRSGVLAVVEIGDTKSKQRIRADVLQAFIDSRSFGSTT
jgi:excisionase family DNA binding protein